MENEMDTLQNITCEKGPIHASIIHINTNSANFYSRLRAILILKQKNSG